MKSLIQNEKWENWKWQLKNVVRSIDGVEEILGITFEENIKKALEETVNKFPMAITPYYLSLINKKDYYNDPIFKQAVPCEKELIISKCDMVDPLYEEKDSPVKGLTHRYPDRVLFHISNTCAMYCRHCTRKRKVGDKQFYPSKDMITKGIEYIKNTPVVRDVLLSGGDPLMLPDHYLDWILGEISEIPHVEVIRIGTRIPVVLPFRITASLIQIFEKYDNLWINTHFNHPNEITPEASIALKKITKAGIPVGNQSVLLSGVNDCPKIMKKLFQKLVQNRVRPYYLYQCDLSEGLEHFRTCIGKGIEIMESLRGHTSGIANPTYVVDAPGGGGKIPIMPNYIISWSANKVVLRNYEGMITTYKEPDHYHYELCERKCKNCKLSNNYDDDMERVSTIGVEKLLADDDDTITLIPKEIEKERD